MVWRVLGASLWVQTTQSNFKLLINRFRIWSSAPSMNIKPDHILFDNNCSVAKVVWGKDPFFDDIGLTVDVFHFKAKHSETDLYCQQYCNPVAYPELLLEDEKGWYFNSSIAEQTNVWLGGYHAICHEMLINKYTFFLDEMILHRNCMTREKLMNEKQCPSNGLHSSE